MPAIASRLFFGVVPPVWVAALRKRVRQSSFATVAKAEMSEPSVFKFASVVVWVLFSGSKSTLPQPPVAGSTRLGAFPAAIRSPSGFPEFESPLMNCAPVNAEATHQRGFDLRESARTADRCRERSEPGGSRDRRLGQSAFGSAKQHPDHDARELEHARLADLRLRHRSE